MARFDKLELSAASPQPAAESTTAPRDETDWLVQADGQRRRGQYENALRYYSRALELDKSLVVGWLGQVQMLIQLEEYVEADVWSRKAIELFPNNGELLAARGQALCRSGDLKQAHAACDGSLKQPGQSAYRWLARGELMLAAGQDVDRHCFDKARQLDSDWLLSLEISLVYLHYDKPNRALEFARQAAERGHDQQHVWYVRAVCENELGLTAAARTSLERCLEVCPGHVDAERLVVTVGQFRFSPWRLLRRWFGN